MFHLYILNIVFAYSNHLRNSICVVDKSRVLDFNNISEKCDKFLSERLKNFDLDLLKDMREGSINQLSKKIIKFIKTEPYNVKSMFVNFVSYGDFSSYISTSGQPDTSYKSPCYIFKNSKIVQYKGIISELMCNPKNI